jgi:threonine/homoserine/homoserine lactone efflux protein
MDSIFFHGFIVGLLIGAPFGPIGVLCIRRTLVEGALIGLVSGIGVATVDAFYGGIAGAGVSFVSQFLAGHRLWFRLAAGIVVAYMGIKTFFARTAKNASPVGFHTLLNAYGSTLLITFTNPLIFFASAVLLAGVGVKSVGTNYFFLAEIGGGVFCGSVLWWIVINSVIVGFKLQFKQNVVWWINKISGILICCFGVYFLCR